MYRKDLYSFTSRDKACIKHAVLDVSSDVVESILFGSTLEGYLLPRSDIDLIVVVSGIEGRQERYELNKGLKHALGKHFTCPIDLKIVNVSQRQKLQKDFLDGVPYEVL